MCRALLGTFTRIFTCALLTSPPWRWTLLIWPNLKPIAAPSEGLPATGPGCSALWRSRRAAQLALSMCFIVSPSLLTQLLGKNDYFSSYLCSALHSYARAIFMPKTFNALLLSVFPLRELQHNHSTRFDIFFKGMNGRKPCNRETEVNTDSSQMIVRYCSGFILNYGRHILASGV